jgi:IclR family transcriptional regulator, pca regulon regulatory protein
MVQKGRQDGYSYADQEYYRGDINVAAPILGVDGWAIAAINISVPVSRWSVEEARRELAPHVIETARAISGASAVRRDARVG